MCVAIIIHPGKVPDIDAMRACRAQNPHGLGLAYYKDPLTPVHFQSVTENPEDFYKRVVKEAIDNPDKYIFVHFRARTMGEMSKDNCHPFKLKNGFFMHQGGFTGLGSVGMYGKSDTHEMADLLHDLHHEDYENFITNMGARLGNNIVMFLTKTGVVKKGGSDYSSGFHTDGCWYSNFWWKTAYARMKEAANRLQAAAAAEKKEEQKEELTDEEIAVCFPHHPRAMDI